MKRLILLAVLLFGFTGLIITAGCSNDDDKILTTTPGDTTDLGFQFVEEMIVDDMFSDVGSSLELTFELLEEQGIVNLSSEKESPLLALQEGPGDIIITGIDTFYFTDDYWFVFVFTATISQGEQIIEVTGADSAQLLNEGIPIHFSAVENGFDGIKAYAHFNVSSTEYGELGFHHRLEAEVLNIIENDSLVLINGTTRDTVHFVFADTAGECNLELIENTSVNDLEVLLTSGAETDDCPIDGSIHATVFIDLACTGDGSGGVRELNIEGTWTADATVNDNNTATIVVTGNNQIWTVTEELDCGH